VTAGFQCATCGQWHAELPLSFHAPAPHQWFPELADDDSCALFEDQCIIGDAQFVRGLVQIPVVGSDESFEWGVWVSLSADNFQRMTDLWQTSGRESEPPYFGWLCTALPVYDPPTLMLKTAVHTRPVGSRPLIELEPTDHPLAVEQREGVTRARVQQIAEALLHPAP